jgi:uncharacterized repeat protein (TIGR03803 family)
MRHAIAYLKNGALTAAVAIVLSHVPAAAQRQVVLHAFHAHTKDGAMPLAGLVMDKNGSLYGSTSEGGGTPAQNGVVFKLTPGANETWTESVLYAFAGGADGFRPRGKLALDAAGNLYGVTEYGGSSNFGTVFELSPSSSGPWTKTILYSFAGGTDGSEPNGGVIIDAKGNLYGTATYGGCQNFGLGCGIVFELSPESGSTWNETILHTFAPNGPDGYNPFGELIFDSKGNLYGATNAGGTDGQGTVYQVSPQAGGGWTESVLYSFLVGQSDGADPLSGPIMDARGNLYGATYHGGNDGAGVVYKLSPKSDSTWSESVLHSFNAEAGSGDALDPQSSLTFDAHGDLYGTTPDGGANGWGAVFELQPSAGGNWTEKVAFSFNLTSGAQPYGTLLFSKGTFYGTTAGGGPGQGGTAFKFIP